MSTERIDVRCPNCGSVFEVARPLDLRRWLWDPRSEKQIDCPVCTWEFCIDSEGEVSDDGDVENEWEFEIDAEGELVFAQEDSAPLSLAEIRDIEAKSFRWWDDDLDWYSEEKRI